MALAGNRVNNIMHFSNSNYSQTSSTEACNLNAAFGASQSRIIPTLLWIALLGWVARVTVFVRQRPGSTFSSVDIYAAVQISIVFVVLLITLSSSRFLPLITETRRTSVIMLFVYYILGALSALWSQYPIFTFYRAFEFATLLMGALLALSYSSDFFAAERKILFVSSIVIVLSICMQLKLGGFRHSLGEWHVTTYTTSGAMLFCYCAGEYFSADKNRKKILKRYGLFALAMVILGTSSGSFIATFFGLLLILFLYRNVGMWVVGIFFLSMVLLIGVDWTPIKDIVFHGKSERAIITLHGRLGMWQSFIGQIYRNPFLGHGFGVFMRSATRATAGHPHNSLFAVLLGTGLVGAIPVFLYFLRIFREFWKTTGRKLPGAIGCAAGISTGLINSLSTPFVLDKWDESTLVFACLMSLFILFVFAPYKEEKSNVEMFSHIAKN